MGEKFNPDKVWGAVLEGMKLTVSAAIFNTYLKQTGIEEVGESGGRLVFTVGCGSAMIRDFVDKRFYGQMTMELERVTERKCEVVFKIQDLRFWQSQRSASKIQESVDTGPLFAEKDEVRLETKKFNLRDDYTFENYAVGGSNQMAYAAAKAVAGKPGAAYNPLFIYGGVGVGKTHLMQAIGHVMARNGESRVLFCPGEAFTNDLVLAIQQKTTDKVRAKYRKLKLLMVDDVQFIAGKMGVQEEFFHTFNAIQADGGQIVMTSDRPPEEMVKLEARLRSRFGAGLIVDIGQPDFELRSAILLIKAKQKQVELPMRAAQLIAERVEGVRELEGWLSKIKSAAETRHLQIDETLVGELLNIKNRTSDRKLMSPGEIMGVVGNFYGFGQQQIKSGGRTKRLAWARQVVMYLLNKEMGLGLEEIGRLIGGRDHTTVIHGRDKVIAEMGISEKIAGEIGEIKRRVLTAG